MPISNCKVCFDFTLFYLFFASATPYLPTKADFLGSTLAPPPEGDSSFLPVGFPPFPPYDYRWCSCAIVIMPFWSWNRFSMIRWAGLFAPAFTTGDRHLRHADLAPSPYRKKLGESQFSGMKIKAQVPFVLILKSPTVSNGIFRRLVISVSL